MRAGALELARSRSCQAGMSLIELVVAIAITSLIAGVMVSFIARPMQGYSDVRLRAELVDVAEAALRRMARDVRAALPNSLRVSADGRHLELIHTADGGRYRDGPGVNPSTADHTPASDWLDFASDAQWNLLGRLSNLSFTYGAPLAAGHRVAVYVTSTSVYADAEAGADPGVITPSGSAITLLDDGDEDQIVLSSAHTFQFSSPRQRLYLVDTPISYRCDLAGETLTRFAGYSIAALQPTNPSAPPLSGGSAALVTQRVTGCVFSYDPGTLTRSGLVTIALTLSKQGEQVRLLQQVHVDNTP